MTDGEQMPEDKETPQYEDEGSRTAARAYNEKTKQFVENADAERRSRKRRELWTGGKATSCARRRSKVAPTSARKTHRFIATSGWFSIPEPVCLPARLLGERREALDQAGNVVQGCAAGRPGAPPAPSARR